MQPAHWPLSHRSSILRVLTLLIFALLIAALSSLITYWFIINDIKQSSKFYDRHADLPVKVKDQTQNLTLPSQSQQQTTVEKNAIPYEKRNGYKLIQQVLSPDGSLIAIKGQIPDINIITIKDKNGNILHDDVMFEYREIIWVSMESFGLKGRGQVGYTIKEWMSNSILILQINPASGDRFEVELNALTGKLDTSTFQRIK